MSGNISEQIKGIAFSSESTADNMIKEQLQQNKNVQGEFKNILSSSEPNFQKIEAMGSKIQNQVDLGNDARAARGMSALDSFQKYQEQLKEQEGPAPETLDMG